MDVDVVIPSSNITDTWNGVEDVVLHESGALVLTVDDGSVIYGRDKWTKVFTSSGEVPPSVVVERLKALLKTRGEYGIINADTLRRLMENPVEGENK